MTEITQLSPSDFEGKRLIHSGTLAVLFLAQWCPFCSSFYPGFQEAMNGKSVPWAVADISEEENPLWEIFDVAVVPTIIVFKNGESVFRRDGVRGRGLSQKAIDETIQECKNP